METSEQPAAKPPYGSFQTFWSFIDALGTKPLPPRIDRSMFDGKSGTDQLGILMALRAFGLIEGEDQKVQPALTTLVEDKVGRKKQFAETVRSFYRQQMDVSAQNGTEKMLLDSFGETFGLTGDTRRKAATFFLHAARECGIPVSEHFPKVRSGPGALPGRPRRAIKRKNGAGAKEHVDEVPTTGDEFTVKLRAGGTVTLRVNVGHFALSLHREDREFVQKLMDELTSYKEAPEAPVAIERSDETQAEGGEA